MNFRNSWTLVGGSMTALAASPWTCQADDRATSIEQRVEHVYVDSQGVKLHCAVLGEGPTVVMVHGFPDFWYGWRHQMEALAPHYRVVAMDLRAYNRSDGPAERAAYAMPVLMGDLAAVIRHFDDDGDEGVILAGHDWGGAICWQVAAYMPNLVDKLMICNMPHPRGFRREVSSNPEQASYNSFIATIFADDALEVYTPEALAALWVNEEDRPAYVEAFGRSNIEGMLNYYRQNFPPPGQQSAAPSAAPPMPNVQAPVLMLHGEADTALLPAQLNNNWDWIDGMLTLVVIPDVGHFVMQDAPDVVSRQMLRWLGH